MSARSSSTVRVRYSETDQMGIAYHGNYLAWMEIGRTDLLRERGMTYRQLEERNVRLPVLEAHVEYLEPALYDDVLEVLTTLEELGRARIRFTYEVRRIEDSALAARGGSAPRREREIFRQIKAPGSRDTGSISGARQRRAGGKDPLSSRYDFRHGLLATGSTEHAAVGPDGRARRIPADLRELLG